MGGSAPLANPRHEAFAGLVAEGMDRTAALEESSASSDDRSKGALKVAAHRLFRRKDVQARIAYLRKQAQEAADAASQPFTAAALGSLMGEATWAIRAAHDAAERHGASRQQLTRIRKALTVHAGRVQRLDAPAETPTPSAASFDVYAALTRLRWCACHD